MPCEGCEFPAITGLVEGEEDDTQLGFVAESVEQRLKCMDIVRLSGYVCPPCPGRNFETEFGYGFGRIPDGFASPTHLRGSFLPFR